MLLLTTVAGPPSNSGVLSVEATLAAHLTATCPSQYVSLAVES